MRLWAGTRSYGGVGIVLALTVMGVMFVAAVVYRISCSYASPYYVPGDATGFFPAEAALQYRWAHDLAMGIRALSRDQRAQWPEGLNFGVDITDLMERVAAAVWRVVAQPSDRFFEFAIAFVAVCSSAVVIVVWLAARGTGAQLVGATVAAFLVGFHPWGLGRVLRNFGRENFALAFVLLPCVLLLGMWHRRSWRPRPALPSAMAVAAVVCAAAAQAIAFASWHMARPLFELHATLLLALATFSGASTPMLRRIAAVWVLAQWPFFVLLPVLSTRDYWRAPVPLALTVWALGLTVARSRCGRILSVTGAALVYALISVVAPGGEDSHVRELVWAKVRFAFRKPSSPALLAPEARLMWIEAFNSPTLDDVIWFLGPLLGFGLGLVWAGRARLVVRWRRDLAFQALTALTVVWIGSYLAIERFHIFALFGAAWFLGMLVSEAMHARHRGLVAAWVVLCCAVFAAQVSETLAMSQLRDLLASRFGRAPSRFINRFADTLDLLRWLRNHTRRDDVVLAWFGLSSQIYAYADRPVVVQSKFENPHVRPKVLALSQALYGSPALMETLCRRYGVSYVVYEAPMVLDAGPESFRYVAGVERISTTMTVALMHFWPHELDGFDLVYQNRGFRVFRWRASSTPNTFSPARYGWQPLYDASWCGVGRESWIEDEKLERALERNRFVERRLAAAQVCAASARWLEALRISEDLLREEPRLWQAALLRARVYCRTGNLTAAQKACEQVQIGFPGCEEVPPCCMRNTKGSDRP